MGSSGVWTIFGGTSAATPHVSGAVALAIHAGYNASGAVSLLTSYPRRGPGQTTRIITMGTARYTWGALLAAPDD